ncbi:MAG: membrane-bound lytic murein transglycosylase MltF [Aeromicrobium sp.]|nr:membrane-bound lytic murein transglycosylase MltF [Burkholderiales bacterium]
MKARIAIFVAIAVIAAIVFLGLGVRRTELAPSWLAAPLAAPRTSGELVVLTLRGPTTTQLLSTGTGQESDAQTGFEHDLATMFATELGFAVRFRVMPSYAKLLQQLEANRGHLAAAGLAPTPELRQKFAFGPGYKTTQFQLVYRSADKRPRNIGDIGSRSLAIIAETPAHDMARELTGRTPNLVLEVLPHEATADDLLRALDAKQADFALVDTFGFAVAKRLHPELSAAFNVGREAKVAWAFSNAADFDLQQSAVRFFEKIRTNGSLNRLIDRYYGHINRIQPIDSEVLLEKTQSELPKLKPFFHEAQQLTGIDWRILAAVGYQESHWDALATSPTGVRGLMMLTEDTADRMKVQNRLDAKQSIVGGAKYIALLRDTVPARIPEPDRTWLALAAYNQGYGHLEDARILTARMGLNADTWLDVRKAYPKLRDPEFFETVKHGYCRGDEAVQFVENIRNYTDMLNRLEKPFESDLIGDSRLDDAAQLHERRRGKR